MNEDALAAYRSALEQFLAHGGEEALAAAYELGRRAVAEGHGVLDMATLHHRAVFSLLVRGARAHDAAAEEASLAFFAEALSPFEMAFRGYREANEHLRRLNHALSEQSNALESANRELETFSYSVSHDLRAPLRTIHGFSEMLLQEHREGMQPEAVRLLGRVAAGALEMARLIDGLLEISRASRAQVERARFDVTACARRIAEDLRSTDPTRDVEFEIDEGLIVSADPRVFGAVVQNLLGNAWKFTAKRDHAKIEISRLADGGEGFIVRDNGAGFDPRHAGKLFGPFQRLHAKREFEGTGIGLATVQRIVRRHGGSIRAEGAVGMGATFYVILGQQA